MREIKFRGKDLLNKWRYGDLIQEKRKIRVKKLVQDKWKITSIKNEKVYMIKKDKTAWTVKEETIGQYTGLRDKNGKEIYEGDMIYEDFYELKAEVVFIDGSFLLDYKDFFYKYGELHVRYQSLGNYDPQLLEVKGNIYDNPQLLKESD